MDCRQVTITSYYASKLVWRQTAKRFIKPAGTLGMPWVNWRTLRTSHAVWLKLAGADPKDAQGQMLHSRISTTMDIYTQFVPESQVRVVKKLSTLRVQ